MPCETAALGDVVSEDEIDFLLETAGAYLAKRPTRDDILSRFAGVRPLVSRARATNTAQLSRSHEMFVDEGGLVTITGGKWTTYRRMAEEAVDAVTKVGALRAGKCVTETLPIKGPMRTAGERLHPDLPYTRDDVVRAVRDEMAMSHEDVLARRTRAQFLNERAASELVPMVEEIMVEVRSKN